MNLLNLPKYPLFKKPFLQSHQNFIKITFLHENKCFPSVPPFKETFSSFFSQEKKETPGDYFRLRTPFLADEYVCRRDA